MEHSATRDFYEVGNLELRLFDSSLHGRRASDRSVDLAEIVVGVVKSNRCIKVLPLLGKRIGQTAQTAAVHANGVILLFDIGR